MIKSVLVASRGVGACSVIRRLQRLGIRTVAVYSEADRTAPHALMADRAICIGNAPGAESYAQAAVVLDAARVSGVDAIHPVFGTLSGNADFAQAVEHLGLAFIGPHHEAMRAFANLAELGALVCAPQGPLLEAKSNPGQDSCLELHVFGDGSGGAISLGETALVRQKERCSLIQSPALGIKTEALLALRQAVVSFAKAIRYRALGTVSLRVDESGSVLAVRGTCPALPGSFALIEARFGVDLVELSLRAAQGLALPGEVLEPKREYGVAVHVVAGAPMQDAPPTTGIVTALTLPDPGLVECGIDIGMELGAGSDRTLLTLTAAGDSPAEVAESLGKSLTQIEIGGIETNLDELRLAYGPESISQLPKRFEVQRPGTFTIVVDYPGRLGYWPIGVPPSGPMDDLSHRYANRIVGNSEGAASLEMTLTGPTLRFDADTVVALVGANMPAFLDEQAIAQNRPVTVHAGQTLRLGTIIGPGSRTYLAIRGGVQVASYLNSSTTFTLGGFGGHNGRALRTGDSLRIGNRVSGEVPLEPPAGVLIDLTNRWEIGVLYGPHAAPEFFTNRDIRVLFDTEYEVHFNSNRTGVRLIGPKPEWARADGGEAGLHPSNIHDVAYAIGAIDFTGDMPILLGPDGPSLGGFVCPATVVSAELWKLGQLRPGDRVKFVSISDEQAIELQQRQSRALSHALSVRTKLVATAPAHAIIAKREATEARVAVTYRRSGDAYLLVEYGPMALDLRLRFRVHALMQWLNARELPGIIELTPGIRSLQIHFDAARIPRKRLLSELERAEGELPSADALEVPSRIVHLPLSWDDPQTRLAIQKYTQSVRPDAPWCPSNIEFIRRINGLADEKAVYDIVFGASYLVLGLGDVYLGAPVATPIDPRHRLVTTKYNPARTWTPENAVGIGGAYLCIYGMEGPGGYQFVGRTIQVYNRYRRTRRFTEQQPWLLQFFDQLRFYPVSGEQLLDHRRDFLTGKFDIEVEQSRFNLADYQRFLTNNEVSIGQFKSAQQQAFEAERQRWIDNGQLGALPQRIAAEPGREPKHVGPVVECTQ